MEKLNSKLLPYILETLSHKPNLCDTLDNLCEDIEEQLKKEKIGKCGNVRNLIQRAITVGQSLGIITLTNEIIRLPLNFRNRNSTRAPMIPEKTESIPSSEEGRSRNRNTKHERRVKKPHSAGERKRKSQHSIIHLIKRRTLPSIRPRARGTRKGGRSYLSRSKARDSHARRRQNSSRNY